MSDDNIIKFPITTGSIPVEQVLEEAKKADLKNVIVIGEMDNELYVASSRGEIHLDYWLLAVTMKYLMDLKDKVE